MSKRQINNFNSEILIQKTIDEEGFSPLVTGYQKKHIWAVCRFCGEPHRVYGANFKKTGSACHRACSLKEQQLIGSPFLDPKIKEKAQKNRNKNFSKEEIKTKISKGRKKAQSKIEQTNLKKYGVKNPFQSEDIKEKIRQTNLNKLGVAHPMQSEEIQNKTKNTNLQKYGFDNVLKSPSVRESIKSTNLKKYGYEHALKNKEIKAKALSTFNETISTNENHYAVTNTLRKEDFWQEMQKQIYSLEELCDKFKLHYPSVTSRLLHTEFYERYYSTYHFPKQQAQMSIANAIKAMGVELIINDRSTIPPLELDIYLPKYNLAIEYNGSHWHSEARLNPSFARIKHVSKTKKCYDKNIKLIHIFEHSWLERKEQYFNFIKSSLGLNEIKIAARKCELTRTVEKEFINKSHIQGYGKRTSEWFNLKYDGSIVGSMTASSHHRQKEERTIVLNRLCFAPNTTVQGGASKLFKAMKVWAKEQGYKKIISWSDNAWTTGGVYTSLGFELDGHLPPDYFYYDTNERSYKSKQSQQKSATKCPKELTEREWCLQRGLYRIWDCGKKRWVYDLD